MIEINPENATQLLDAADLFAIDSLARDVTFAVQTQLEQKQVAFLRVFGSFVRIFHKLPIRGLELSDLSQIMLEIEKLEL